MGVKKKKKGSRWIRVMKIMKKSEMWCLEKEIIQWI